MKWLVYGSGILVFLSACGTECDPNVFQGGSKCGSDGETTITCQFSQCIEGPVCYDGWFEREGSCPSFAPTCVEKVALKATCIGEIVGTCNTLGFVTCEDAFTQISCADDGTGKLALQRGACGAGSRCRNDPDAFVRGCDPPF